MTVLDRQKADATSAADAEALFEKAHRRRRRRRLLIGTVVIVLVIAVLATSLSLRKPAGPHHPVTIPTALPISPPAPAATVASSTLGVAGPLAVSPNGQLYVADTANDRILVRLPDGAFSVAVGTGTVGFSGDGGPATAAQLTRVTDMVFAPDGSLYIADGNRVRVVTPAGIITTVAGGGGAPQAVSGGTAALAAPLGSPLFLSLAPNGGQLYIDDGSQILALTSAGTLVTVPYAPTSATTSVGGGSPLALDGTGHLYIDGCGGWSICAVAPGGQVSNLGSARRSGGALSVLEDGPGGTVYGEDGPRIVQVAPSGLVTAYQLPELFWLTYFAIAPDGVLYADELAGNTGFEAHQELISDDAGRLGVLWQEANSAPEVPACAVLAADEVQSPAPLAQVPPRPQHLVATWLSGPNAEPCRASVVHSGAALARKLARDIDRAPAWDPASSCPAEQGAGVSLSFYGQGRTRAPTTAAIDVAGCGVVMASSPSPAGVGLRSLTPAIRADLRALATPHWARSYL